VATNPNVDIAKLLEIAKLIKTAKSSLLQSRVSDPFVQQEIRNLEPLLKNLPPLTGNFAESAHPITHFVDLAFLAGNQHTKNLLSAIKPLIRFLPWKYNYPLRGDAPDLGTHIAFAEIIGPEAPYHSDTVCLGLTLIGPQTLYPLHHHPATELYYVLSGVATWTLHGVSREVQPGEYVLHPSEAPHAMETDNQALLALYTWTGTDVKTTSAYSICNRPGLSTKT